MLQQVCTCLEDHLINFILFSPVDQLFSCIKKFEHQEIYLVWPKYAIIVVFLYFSWIAVITGLMQSNSKQHWTKSVPLLDSLFKLYFHYFLPFGINQSTWLAIHLFCMIIHLWEHMLRLIEQMISSHRIAGAFHISATN